MKLAILTDDMVRSFIIQAMLKQDLLATYADEETQSMKEELEEMLGTLKLNQV